MDKKDIEFKLIPIHGINKNMYAVEVSCAGSCNSDADYGFEMEESKMTALHMLIIAYLNLSIDDIPENWQDDPQFDGIDSFGGSNVPGNDRFFICGDRYWLKNFAAKNKLLLKDEMSEDLCDDVYDISVTYYDANGKMYVCEMPDIAEIFDSESKFIEYVRMLAQ